MNYPDLIFQIKEIALAAGQIIMDIYNDEENFQITQKSDDSPLTIADRNANTYICEKLEQLPISYPIISEENKEVPYEIRKNYAYYWLVDPLDGTKEFIKRNGDFTVNIALIHGGEPVMGVVFAPCLDELYWAIKGQGAHLQKAGKLKKMEVCAYKITDKALKLVASRSHLSEETQAFIDKLDEPILVSKGSSLKFLMLANAEAHIYPRMAPTMEWDTAAAQVVLTEAGGVVIDANTGKAVQYNKENMLNPWFIAKGLEL
jgi:3'(2'), 5'-bisphosphate nucleotidase